MPFKVDISTKNREWDNVRISITCEGVHGLRVGSILSEMALENEHNNEDMNHLIDSLKRELFELLANSRRFRVR